MSDLDLHCLHMSHKRTLGLYGLRKFDWSNEVAINEDIFFGTNMLKCFATYESLMAVGNQCYRLQMNCLFFQK